MKFLNQCLVPILVTSLLTSGCAAHVTLPLIPTKGAPLAEREEVFKELSPVPERGLILQRTWGTHASGNFLLLNNGLRVSDAIDLLPAVEAASPTAKFALAASEKRDRSLVAGQIAVGMVAVAAGLAFGSTATTRADGGPTDATWGLLLSGLSLDLLAIIPCVISLVSRFQADVETRSAFAMYPIDLRKRLALDETENAISH